MQHSKPDDFKSQFIKQTIACVIGTRPEAIKMAPVIDRLRGTAWADVHTIATGQQDDLLTDALNELGIVPDEVIPHQRSGVTPLSVLSALGPALDTIFNRKPPAAVIAQGDTTTVFAASVASFYRKTPFVHVEAGLRSHDLYTPFPEEFHRRAIATATSLHCAPTLSARENLLAEGVLDRDIIVSGNTVIDTLLKTAATNARRPADFPIGKTILVTAHRRENFGEPLKQAFVALRAFLDIYPDYSIYFPVHPNPNARDAARAILSDHPRVRLVDPLGYRQMVGALEASWAIVTDSGGLQEEAPALGKPVIVLRDVTERPEAVKAGVVELVGTDRQCVFEALASLHNDAEKYARMARPVFPYGDGQASKRIVEALEGRLNVSAKLVANSNLPPMSRAK